MESGVTANFPAFKKALDLYVRVTRKTVFDAVRNAMGDVAYSAAENTYHTTKEAIDAEFKNLPIKGREDKPRSGNTQFVGQYKIINWERKNKGLPVLGGSKFRRVKKFSIQGPMAMTKTIKRRNVPRNTGPSLGVSRFMDGKYKAFLQARKRSVKWLRIGWAAAAQMMGKPFKRGDFGPATIERIIGLKYGGGNIKQVEADLTEFTIFNNTGRFDHRYRTPMPRSASDIARADAIMTKGLQEGIQKAIYDPKRGLVPYIERNLRRLWASPSNIIT